MQTVPTGPPQWLGRSPWLLLGSIAAICVMVIFLAVQSANRDNNFKLRALLSEANVFMRSMENVSRMGTRGMGWRLRQVQRLMEESVKQPDVLYAALIGEDGRFIAHSDADLIGHTFGGQLPREGQLLYSFTKDEPRAFQVIQSHGPLQNGGSQGMGGGSQGMGSGMGGGWGGGWMMGGGGRHRQMMGGSDFLPGDSGDRGPVYIMVGLDPTPYETSTKEEMNHLTLLLGALAVGVASAFVALYWARHYRTARRSLRDARSYTEALIRRMPVGLVSVDGKNRIVNANPAARDLLGRPLIPGDTLDPFPQFVDLAGRLTRPDQAIEEEIRCGSAGNKCIPLQVQGILFKNTEDATEERVFLFVDLSRVKELEEQLRRHERLVSMGRLAAGVAHEIRNPLGSIKGFARILAAKVQHDEKAREIATVMQNEVDRINRVVSELLDYARPTQLEKTDATCRELLDHSLRLIERDAGERAIQTKVSVEPAALKIHADADRLLQVLLNLYLNSLQAMDKGGELQVSAREEPDQVVLRVADTGPGIPPDNLPHVFDPYFTTKPRGVGLGLAMAHKIVEAHGGDIEVESTVGEGTRFTLRLPHGPQPPATGI